jgi:hypothetical protein
MLQRAMVYAFAALLLVAFKIVMIWLKIEIMSYCCD